MKMETDVLIAGAGPVGLALANRLGLEGVGAIVVEQDPGVAELPRAVSIDDEAMRFMQGIGLLQQTRRIVIAGTGTEYYGSHGQPLFHARGPEPPPNGYPLKNPMDHPELQQVMADGLRRFAEIDLRHRTRLTAIEQDSDSVQAEVEGPDGESATIRARYLVGCDGGRSTVRRELGVGMAGTSSPERWLVVDALNDPHRLRQVMHHGDPKRPHVIVPGRDGRCRYEFVLDDHEQPAEEDLFDLARQLVAPYRQLERDDVVRCVVYTFNSLVAESWRRERALLAGDAAHMMPPFAGQGLNSGLRDVANLAWKLSMVIKGSATPDLLDSYEQERRPHVEAMLGLSVRLGKVIMTRSRLRAAVRDAAFAAGRVIPGFRSYFAEMRFRPAPSYDHGLFLKPADGIADFAGAMFPQVPVLGEDGEPVGIDELLGSRFGLLAVDIGPSQLGRVGDELWDRLGVARINLRLGDNLAPPVEGWTGVIEADRAFHETLLKLAGRIVLIRPDRFAAGSFEPRTERDFVARIEPLLKTAAAAELADPGWQPAPKSP